MFKGCSLLRQMRTTLVSPGGYKPVLMKELQSAVNNGQHRVGALDKVLRASPSTYPELDQDKTLRGWTRTPAKLHLKMVAWSQRVRHQDVGECGCGGHWWKGRLVLYVPFGRWGAKSFYRLVESLTRPKA